MDYDDYCTGCLLTGVKMDSYKPIFPNTENTFEIFFRIPLNFEKTELKFCYECAALLRKLEKFRSKCYRAQNILDKIKQDHFQITKEILQNINREQHKLSSTLKVEEISTVNFIGVTNSQFISVQEFISCDVKEEINTLINSISTNIIKSEQENEKDYEDSFDQVFDNSNENKYEKPQKKKKLQETCTKEILDSESDNEPLSNKVSETTNKHLPTNGILKENVRKNFDISYFEEYATVVFLTPEDARKELLLRKETSNYINSPFKCQYCYRGYEAKVAFENHMKKHSKEYGEFKCDICQLRFLEQRCLCKHRLASHKRKFYCKLCPYVCFCTHQAKTHVSLHKGKVYPCKECGETFSMPNSLLMHKRLKHQTECVCDLCGNTFATPRGLYSHSMKVHRQDKNAKNGPKCEVCKIHFSTEEAWKRHLVLSSKHNVSNGCKNCGETFASTSDLKTHMKIHARKHVNRGDVIKLLAPCSICDKYLVDRSEYKSHMTSSHPHTDIAKKLVAEELTPFVCELCGLGFKKHCYLRYHQQRHAGSRTRAPPPRRAHTCRLCERVFSFKSALNKHMKIHLNIRPHRCDICNKSFISPCDVRVHIQYAHNNVPWPKRKKKKPQE